VTENAETFTCASCGDTHEKGWSDEEAAAEAQQNFPGIDVTDPDEAPVVCDACYQHIMGRARAEAPELIGEGWRGPAPEPIQDFPAFTDWLTTRGYTFNPCPDGCQDKGTEHVHLRHPDGDDGIIWADGRVSEWDLTQPARLIYPAYGGGKRRPPAAASPDSGWPSACYAMSSGSPVHVRPGCRC
jgi:hypothetical protein